MSNFRKRANLQVPHEKVEVELKEGRVTDRRRAAEKWLPRLEQRLRIVRRTINARTEEWRVKVERYTSEKASGEPRIWLGHRTRARFYFLVAVIAFLAEVALAAVAARGWLIGGWITAIGVGAAGTLLVTWIFKALWLLRDESRLPRLVLRRREYLTWAVGAVVILVLAIFAIVRFYAIAVVVMPWVLAALTILLPFFAGGLLAVAELYDERNRLADDFEMSTLEDDQLRRLIELALHLLDRDPPNGDPDSGAVVTGTGESDSGSDSRSPARAAKVVNAILVLALLGASTASASSPVSRLNIWVDTSGSCEVSQVRAAGEAVLDLFEHLPMLEEVGLFPFARALDAVRGPWEVFSFPTRPVFACSKGQTEVHAMFRAAREQHRLTCEREKEAVFGEYFRRRREVEERVAQALVGLDIDTDTPQTCLHHVISRATGEAGNTLTVIISDGAHFGCEGGRQLAFAASGRPPIIVLVPAEGDGDRVLDKMAKRAKDLQSSSEIFVIPSFRVAEQLPALVDRLTIAH